MKLLMRFDRQTSKKAKFDELRCLNNFVLLSLLFSSFVNFLNPLQVLIITETIWL